MSDKGLIDLCQIVFGAINNSCFSPKLKYAYVYDAREYLAEEDIKAMEASFVEAEPVDKILINIESMKRYSLNQIIDIIFHEAVHSCCAKSGVLDIIRRDGWQYHTKEFKIVAEKHGGICKYVNSRIGYHDITLRPDTLNRIIRIM